MHVAGLILDSLFSSLWTLSSEVAQRQSDWLIGPFISFGLHSVQKLIQKRAHFDIIDLELLPCVKNTIPVIFLHGENNNFVPTHHSQKLFTKYYGTDKKLVIIKGAHNSFRSSDFHDVVSTFIFEHLGENGKRKFHKPFTLHLEGKQVFLCKQITLNRKEEEKLVEMADKNQHDDTSPKKNNNNPPNHFSRSTRFITKIRKLGKKNVIVFFGEHSVLLLQPFTVKVIKEIEYDQLRSYSEWHYESFVLWTQEERIYLYTPEAKELNILMDTEIEKKNQSYL